LAAPKIALFLEGSGREVQPFPAGPLMKPFAFTGIFRNRINQINRLQPIPNSIRQLQSYSQPRSEV
jgi:hypothetical protein